MSQPIVREMYTPKSSASPLSTSPLASSSPLSSSPDLSINAQLSNSRPRLHGPSNTGTFKAPSRLTTNNTPSLSAPALAKKHIESQSTSHLSQKTPSSTVANTAARSSSTLSSSSSSFQSNATSSDSHGSSSSRRSSIEYNHGQMTTNKKSSPISQPLFPASESQANVPAMPTGNTLVGGDSTLPSSQEHLQQQQQQYPATTATATTSAFSSAASPPTSVPTIAQRDALTSRVYSVCRSAGYVNWLHLLDMSPLASQHHLSGYNCMKFGKQGGLSSHT